MLTMHRYFSLVKQKLLVVAFKITILNGKLKAITCNTVA